MAVIVNLREFVIFQMSVIAGAEEVVFVEAQERASTSRGSAITGFDK
ncbi:hypothetical protein [Paraburkholderia denitrificans]